MKVWTLTVDDSDGIHTSVHTSENAAVQTLFDDYDDQGEFSLDDMQSLMDAKGLIVYVDEHEIAVSLEALR